MNVKKKKTIVLDVDGVLLNFSKAADDYVLKHYGIKPVFQKDDYNLATATANMKVRYQIETVEEVLNLLDEMVEKGFYKSIPALDGAKEAVDRIKEKDYKVIIVTAIHDGAKDDRLLNLYEELNLVPDEIYCVGMGKSKTQIIKELKPDIFIDDRMKYLEGGDSVYHSVWVDQEESQDGDETLVNVHVKSLKEWADRYLDDVSEILDQHYEDEAHIQIPLKLESVDRKYGDKNPKPLSDEEYSSLAKTATKRIR